MTPLMAFFKWLLDGRGSGSDMILCQLVEPILKGKLRVRFCASLKIFLILVCLETLDVTLKDKSGYSLLDYWFLGNVFHSTTNMDFFYEEWESTSFWQICDMLVKKGCKVTIDYPVVSGDPNPKVDQVSIKEEVCYSNYFLTDQGAASNY
jgi:hypothetical protein